MSDFLVDAIAQFVKGDEWKIPVGEFMNIHKIAFVGLSGNEDEHTLQHHAIFMEFKELVERLLEGVIADLGCDANSFVAALEEAAVREAGGPKEEETQLLIKTLLSYDDFKGFCALMQQYVEWNVVPSIEDEANEAEQPAEMNSAAAKAYLSSSEWILQEVLARSILDAYAAGQLTAEDEAYLPWAQTIMEMKISYEALANSTAECSTIYLDPMVAKMNELEANLTKEKLRVDLLVAQRLAERNATMRQQMRQLCLQTYSADAKEGEENNMAYICSRLEAIPEEIKSIKKKCFAVKSVSQTYMDEIYLYLKEKVHYKYDLAEYHDDIATFIFARISPNDAAVVNNLLQWLLLESEALELQKELQQLSFSSPRAEAKDENVNDHWVQVWSEQDQAYYYLNSITNATQWEPPTAKDGEPILGYWDDINQWVPYQFVNTPTELVAEEKSTEMAHMHENKSSLSTPALTKSDDNLKKIGLTLETLLTSDTQPNSTDMFDMEASLQKVLKEHADESKKLEIALQVEHARQIQDIQRRKAQRRKERKMKRAQQINESTAPPLAAPTLLDTNQSVNPCQINICLPEGGKIDLLSLLSQADLKLQRDRRCLTDSTGKESTSNTLNSTSLLYLAEKLALNSKLIEIEHI
ncbi:sporangia induced hypothetical protein [Thraustotheca clavata]|uniref:Cilia- and flagella-associated protein 36 n=1 Tax=Thraustotheca clavata TaxID=74557 RepID=A0A1W0A3W8_9STRA|nr:sporangia induced hypothetical protein [Thraustotheca clavata]